MANAIEKLSHTIEQAKSLHRQWFKQLQAIEDSPQWPEGWKRLDMLRSLIKRSNNALIEQDEFEIEQATIELSRFIRDEQK